jgi:SlyX protein
MTARLNDLEARIALMDDMLDALNRTVFEQQRAIESLQLQLKHVYAQVQGMQPAERADAQQDIPPHY